MSPRAAPAVKPPLWPVDMPLEPRPGGRLWMGVAGKGGAGKSVLSGTLARVLARRGNRVLAIDTDPMPGMAHSLGVAEPEQPLLTQAAFKPEKGPWRLKSGVGPVTAVRRYTTEAPDGVRLMQLGKADTNGLAPSSVNAFLQLVRRMHEAPSLYEWAIVGDLAAGPRQPAAGFSPYARLYVVVVEPTSQSAMTGRRCARIARGPLGADVIFVASKVRERRGAPPRRAPARRARGPRDPRRPGGARSREPARRGPRRGAGLTGRAGGGAAGRHHRAAKGRSIMKIAVSGKGGAGKTTISGTIARALARAGHDVIAIDADVNPMLGISLGLGMDGTERLAGLRQQVSASGNANDAIHEHTIEGLIERFGEDAPDGVRIVVASRVDMPDHGCLCCGVSADRLLREMEGGGRTVVGDLEAGIGVLSRMKKGSLDAVLVVANPTPKSIEVARRAAEAAVAREIPMHRRRQPHRERRGPRDDHRRPRRARDRDRARGPGHRPRGRRGPRADRPRRHRAGRAGDHRDHRSAGGGPRLAATRVLVAILLFDGVVALDAVGPYDVLKLMPGRRRADGRGEPRARSRRTGR